MGEDGEEQHASAASSRRCEETPTPTHQSHPTASSEGQTASRKKKPKPKPVCYVCQENRPALVRPKTGKKICKGCFYECFEAEIHQTIIDNELFKPGERVAIAASGGKDSTVLAQIMTTLNERYSYGLDLFLLSIDEGITGYRDDSLETVKRNQQQYQVPLRIVSYKDLYGWSMDEIVERIGLRNNCTFCGVFRRQALDRGAAFMNADKIVTGHNADDVAETVLMNILRGDIARLARCVSITTGMGNTMPRCKPFKYTYEKEIVLYAYFKKLDYFSTECIYSPNAYRGYAREFLKDLEAIRPSSILDIIYSAESFRIDQSNSESAKAKMPTLRKCENCGYISSQRLCKACVLLDGLDKGKPRMGLATERVRKKLDNEQANSEGCSSPSSNTSCCKTGDVNTGEESGCCQANGDSKSRGQNHITLQPSRKGPLDGLDF
eukprot:gb/GECG01016756.1/.p1 GENE.gb/GECG01016756.1/~~gb/GECG01016756.1/.p1  ORF type:complete len:437 (+),score=51.13 gb/GECG01016756.1/:1-1311(+)